MRLKGVKEKCREFLAFSSPEVRFIAAAATKSLTNSKVEHLWDSLFALDWGAY